MINDDSEDDIFAAAVIIAASAACKCQKTPAKTEVVVHNILQK